MRQEAEKRMHEREFDVALNAARGASRYLLQEYKRFQVIPDAPAAASKREAEASE